MNSTPTVSVLIFAYNHENYIDQAIRSVISQKCEFPIEIIISDDFSTDDTLQKILPFQALSNVSIITNEVNIGLNKSFVNAVNAAKGEYIALLGGDDFWINESKLAMQVKILQDNSDVAYVHTAFQCLYEVDGSITHYDIHGWKSILTKLTGRKALTEMLCHNWTAYPSASTSCFRRKPLIEGLMNCSQLLEFGLPGEGTIINTSMCMYGGLYYFIPCETTVYRIRVKSLSHHTSLEDRFNYRKDYYRLKLYAAKLYNLGPKDVKRIVWNGIYELFTESKRDHSLNYFIEFFNKQDFSLAFKLMCQIRFSSAPVEILLRRLSKRFVRLYNSNH